MKRFIYTVVVYKAIFLTLRLTELLIHLSVPCLAMVWFGANYVDAGLGGVWFLVMPILILWFMVFVILQQHRYPHTLQGGLFYTGITVAQLMSMVNAGSLQFSSYAYFMNTLLALCVLFIFGGVHIPFSKKSTKKMRFFGVVVTCVLIFLLSLFLWMIGRPLIEYYWSLDRVMASVFVLLFGMQTIKLVMSLVNFSRSANHHEEMVHPLPELLLVGSSVMGAAAVPFIALVANTL